MKSNVPVVLVLTGMLASGKTTFMINWYLEMKRRGFPLPRMIVNDVGGGQNVDAALIRAAIGGDAEIKDMTSGCIGCDDRESFLSALRESLARAIDTVIEPSGLIDGKELETLLKEADARFVVLCLVRVDALPGLIAADGDLRSAVDSQLKLADTVWFTATSAGNDAFETAAEYVRSVAPRAEIGSLLPRNSIPKELVDRLHSGHRVFRGLKKGCGCAHGKHNCGTTAGHHGGLHVGVLPMPEGATPESIATLCASLPGLRRAKCILDGCMVQLGMDGGFEVIHCPGMKRGMGNFFSEEPLPADAFASLRPGPEDAGSAALWLMEHLPSPLSADGQLRVITDRDWTALKLAFTDGVPEDVRKRVVGRYVEWRLEAAALFRGDPDRWAAHPKLGYWKRWLGAELALRCARHPELLVPGMAEKAAAFRPATMAMEGLLLLEELTLDPEDTAEDPGCLRDVVAFGLECEGLDRLLVGRAVSHVRAVAIRQNADPAPWDGLL